MKIFYTTAIWIFMFALMFMTSGCNKEMDSQTTPLPPDSTDTTNHTTHVAQSRNCTDSVVGVYYGNYISTDYRYTNGKKETVIERSGRDTLILSKKDSVTLQYITTRRHLMRPGYDFKFNTTDVLYGGPGSYSYLNLFPAKDSIYYVFSFSAGTPPQDGEHVYSTFAGKK